MSERTIDPKNFSRAERIVDSLNGRDRNEFRMKSAIVEGTVKKTLRQRARQIQQLGIFPTIAFAIYDQETGYNVEEKRAAVRLDFLDGSNPNLILHGNGKIFRHDFGLTGIVGIPGITMENKALVDWDTRGEISGSEYVFYANRAYAALASIVAEAIKQPAQV